MTNRTLGDTRVSRRNLLQSGKEQHDSFPPTDLLQETAR